MPGEVKSKTSARASEALEFFQPKATLPGGAFLRQKLKAKRFVLLLILLSAALFAFAFKFISGFFAAPAKAPPPVVTVTVEPATVRSLDKSLTVTGTVSAWDPITIGAEVGGLKIVSVLAEEGDLVKKGQILAKLNSDVLQAQMEQIQAKIDASKADLKKAIQPNRAEQIAALKAAYQAALANVGQEEANLAQMRATLAEAEHNADRYRTLGDEGAVSQADAEDRVTQAKTALAQLQNAQQKLASVRQQAEEERQSVQMAFRGGRAEDVQIAQAKLKELMANLAQLQAQIEQTKICAPEDGLITRRDAHIGDIATLGQALFAEVRANRLELKAQISDQDLGKFQAGQKVEIFAVDDGEKAVAGKVRAVSPLVDESTRLGTVRIDIPEHSGLKPGMFVRGTVDLGEAKALAVPAKSVLAKDGLPYVFVLNGNHADWRAITLGARTADYIEVLSGIAPGEKVIVKGAGFLKDGDVVAVGR